MAFEIEHQQKGTPWLLILFVIVVIAALGFGVYYFFSTGTEIVQIVIPEPLQEFQELAGIELNYQELRALSDYELLRTYQNLQAVDSFLIGKSNPFSLSAPLGQ